MNQTDFWQIIDLAREQGGDNEKLYVSAVKKQLITLSLDDIRTFGKLYVILHNLAGKDQIAENLLNHFEFVSDDGFVYFCAWLISRGKSVFFDVIHHPEHIGVYINKKEEFAPMMETLNYVANDALHEKLSISQE